MPQAIGWLRYGPRGVTVPRKGRWLILECDRDWFHMLAPHIHREMSGQWVFAVDDNRVFDSTYEGRPQHPCIRKHNLRDRTSYVDTQEKAAHIRGPFIDRTPHLAFLKPPIQCPAWGTHISVVRGNIERATGQIDVWDLASEIGGVEERLAEATRKQNRRAVRFLRQESRTLWAALDHLGAPDWVMPGFPVKFRFNPELKLAGKHWFLDVQCPTLERIRVLFGLDPDPRVPFHLTVAVTSGA